jgi:dephospho-CoA kinase
MTPHSRGQNPPERYLIGLTGNIATGKSTVAAMLAELGATVIDADQAAHLVMRRGGEVYDQIVATFGPGVVGADGEIDRARLGHIVFGDPAMLRSLEQIVHPAVGVEVGRRITQATTAVVVVEAIKLIEAGWHHMCQALWVTTCRSEQQVERLRQERAQSFAEARRRVNAQPPQSQKIVLADVVIDTSGDVMETRRQVEAAWQAIDKGGNYGPIRSVPGIPGHTLGHRGRR